MNDSTGELRTRESANTDVWGGGLRKRLAKRAGIDIRLIKQLDEPIQVPSVQSYKNYVRKIDNVVEQLELEKRRCESERRNAENFVCNGFMSIEPSSSTNGPSANSSGEATIEDQIVRVWEENKAKHYAAERKLLYPTTDRLTQEINTERLVHYNQVQFAHRRFFYIPVIAKKTRERYEQLVKTNKHLKSHNTWKHNNNSSNSSNTSNASNSNNNNNNNSSNSDEEDHKREKRATTSRSIARITRSQTSNMVECESATSRDPEYYYPRQADVSHYHEVSKYRYINDSNRLTINKRPMCCQDVPRDEPCPKHCNCPSRIVEELERTRPWTDMEKFIYLQCFFNRPKDYRYIANCLVNRSIQDVIDFYYQNKRGMYYKLLLRVQLVRWKNMNYDQRPMILAAAYGIGLPIPEKVFCPNYADFDIGEFIKDGQITMIQKGVKPEDMMLLDHPTYKYNIEDNKHITPEILRERRVVREKRIEELLMRMGVDLRHCIPTEEKIEVHPVDVNHQVKKIPIQELVGSGDEN